MLYTWGHLKLNILVGKLQKKTPFGRYGHICGKNDKKNQVIQ